MSAGVTFTKCLNNALPLTSIPSADTVWAYARQMQAGAQRGHASTALCSAPNQQNRIVEKDSWLASRGVFLVWEGGKLGT